MRIDLLSPANPIEVGGHAPIKLQRIRVLQLRWGFFSLFAEVKGGHR